MVKQHSGLTYYPTRSPGDGNGVLEYSISFSKHLDFFFSFLKKLLSFHSKEALAFVPSLWGGGVGAGIFSLLPLLGPFGRSINEIGVRQTKRRKI